MFQSKEEKAKEEIRRAWRENDLAKLIHLGFAQFMKLICGDGPLPFQKFLKYTGDYLDHYIIEVCQQRRLNYVGGKMIMELRKDKGDAPEIILLFADFYFQTADKQWVLDKKQGQVSIDRFIDWDTDGDAIELQKAGKLELSIEPPEAGVD